jgi:hypothetical protein
MHLSREDATYLCRMVAATQAQIVVQNGKEMPVIRSPLAHKNDKNEEKDEARTNKAAPWPD